jgi:hypothetical protein
LLTTNLEIVKCLQAIKVMTPSAHSETLIAIRPIKKVAGKATFRGRRFVSKLFAVDNELKSFTMI